MKNVNAREVGDFISVELLDELKPNAEPKQVKVDDKGYPVLPIFRKPVVDSVELPFGWYYCNISKRNLSHSFH